MKSLLKVWGVRIGKKKNKTDMAVLICEELVRRETPGAQEGLDEAVIRLKKAGDDAAVKKAGGVAAKAAGADARRWWKS